MIRLFAAFSLFLVSGFAALVYQVVWQRLLAFFSGADVYSATIVVAAFMSGLGCGSFVGGQVADRVSRVSSILLFAGAEVAVAAFGFFSRSLFYDGLYSRWGYADLGPTVTALTLFLALIWPTFFMGASLPLLSRGLTSRVSDAAPTIGWLYAVNTAGAAVGAFVATWVLMPRFGLSGSLLVAASLNIACAVTASFVAIAGVGASFSTDLSAGAESVAPLVNRTNRDASEPAHVVRWALVFALSGFLGLSLEIVWFRLLGVMLKSTAFTFGTILSIYLAGLGIGGAIGSVMSSRVRRPALGVLTLQASAGAYAAVSIWLLVNGLDRAAVLRPLWDYLGRYDGVDLLAAAAFWGGQVADAGTAPADVLRLYLLLPVLLVGPPTMMAGISFPLLQRVVQTDIGHLGRRVGLLLTANLIGSTLGSFVTGLLLLAWLGTAGTLTLLFLLSTLFAGTAISYLSISRPSRGVAYVVVGVAAAALTLSMPTSTTLWARLHGAAPRNVIAGEDGTGLSVLRADRPDFRRTVVFVNGLGQSWVPYGGIHTVLGALPAFLHERPDRALLIGLGSGDTLFAMAGRRELSEITSVEIIAPQLRTLQALYTWGAYPGLGALLQDPRIRHVNGDGRRFLSSQQTRYDIVQADALRPHSAYAGNLYSDAYFSLLRSRLAARGLAVSWAPTERVVRTFASVFPYVAQHGDIVIGSNDPLVFDGEVLAQRLSDPQVDAYYGAAGLNIRELLAPYARGWRIIGPSEPRTTGDINTDLHPRDEFEIPGLWPPSF
ncbi:MAG: fused MFS/spermidine synthase [Vicinamibacterales bacterium]